METFIIILLIGFIISGSAFIILRLDVFGARSALKSASNSEETEETIKGSLANARLWVKQMIGVVLDQFPDNPASTQAGGEGQSR